MPGAGHWTKHRTYSFTLFASPFEKGGLRGIGS
jgi:hypothetical protein